MFDECVYFNINSLSREINKLWEKAFSQSDLTPPLGYLLLAIIEKPGLVQKELAQELDLDKSVITRYLNQLTEKNLIERCEKDGDNRCCRIYSTAKGKRMKTKIDKNLSQLAQRLSPKDQSEMNEFVKKSKEIKGKIKLLTQEVQNV